MNRLTANHIKLNQPLPFDAFDAQGNLLLRKGYVVDRQTQIEKLLERGLYASDDDFNFIQSQRPENTPAAFNPFWLWDDIFSKLVYVLKYANSEDLFEDKITAIAYLLVNLTDTDPDAALAGILLKDGSRYAYAHSLHVAILTAIISRRLGWPENLRLEAIQAALTMNVAMIDLQMILLYQKEPLSEEQRFEVRMHPKKGVQFLSVKGIGNPHWLDAVRLHHETLPLKTTATPDGAAMSQLLRVLDVFCAKVSPRAYRRALQPPVAAREIFVQEREGCGQYVEALIKEIGLYMPGTFVKLANGETALVVKRGGSVNTPRVMSLTRGDGMPFLEAMRRDTAKSEFAVKAAVPREKIMHALNLSKIWGY